VEIPEEFTSAPGAAAQLVEQASKVLGLRLPDDYVAYLKRSNGGEGFVGDAYLVLWKAEELVEFNKDYEMETRAPGLIAFGGNGGGEGFAFDTRSPDMPVVQIPFIGLSLQHALPVAPTFPALFKALRDRDG
jgi:hypothetical protein